LWGVENFHEITIRHTKFAPDRFAQEARPALQSFASGSTRTFVEGVMAAKAAKIATDDDERLEFLVKRAGLSGRMAKAANARHLVEEGRPVETVWDAAQAITAIARDITHQDARIEIERKAGALLDKVAA
jgi:pyruvate-formate lyase